MGASRAIFLAEWLVEWRNPAGFVSALLFALIVLLAQSLAVPAYELSRPEVSQSAFFISILFASILGEYSRIARDQKTGTSFGLALTSASPARLFFGKMAVGLAQMTVLELCLFPMLVLFYNVPLSAGRPPCVIAAVCLSANFSFACLTTLLGAGLGAWKGASQALALPIMTLPFLLPVLVSATLGAARAISGEPVFPFAKLLLASNVSAALVGSLTYGKILGKQ